MVRWRLGVNQGNEQLDMERIASEVRHSQPDLLIVDRTIGGAMRTM